MFFSEKKLAKCRKNNVAGDLHGMQTDRVFWVCLSKYHKIHVFRRPLRGPRVKKRRPQMAPEALWPRWCQMVPDGVRRSRVCESDLKYCKTRTTVNGGFVVRWSLSSTPLTTRQNYRKNAYRSIFATVLPGLDPIGFVESDVKSRKTRALRARGFVFCLCVCLF